MVSLMVFSEIPMLTGAAPQEKAAAQSVSIQRDRVIYLFVLFFAVLLTRLACDDITAITLKRRGGQPPRRALKRRSLTDGRYDKPVQD